MTTRQPVAIDGFVYRGELGTGAHSVVYRYEHAWSRQSVAVKVLSKRVTTQRAIETFVDGMVLPAALSVHPAIASVHVVGVDGGHAYLVTDYCASPSIGAQLPGQAMRWQDVVDLLINLSGGLATAHGVNVYHGNVKPSNILRLNNGVVALSDFCVAELIAERGPRTWSLPWAAPEALSADPGVVRCSESADIYGLAATGYSLLTGLVPFTLQSRRTSEGELIERIRTVSVAMTTHSDAPRELLQLLGAAMAKRPEDRPPSMTVFAHSLQHIQQTAGLPTTGLVIADGLVESLNDETVLGRPVDDKTVLSQRALGHTVFSAPALDQTELGRPNATQIPVPPDNDATLLGRPDNDATVVARRVNGPQSGATRINGKMIDAAPHDTALMNGDTSHYAIRKIPVPKVRVSRSETGAQPRLHRVDTSASAEDAARKRLRRLVALGFGVGILMALCAIVIVVVLH